jgi:hypothetical protein
MNRFYRVILFAFVCLPAVAQTHRFQVSAIAAVQSGIVAPTPTTWYVRADGGSRYTAQNRPQGQCNGKADVSYAAAAAAVPAGGALINLPCAFGDVRFLWTDGQYTNSTTGVFPAWGWVIAGGDTVIIRGGPWRVGQNGPNSGDSFGLNGNPYAAGAPTPPSGYATQHTRILGENFASCGTQSAMTQIFGGYGVFQVLSLGGAAYVDVQCIELTRHSQCIKYGSPAVPAGCNTGFPLDDYALNGITTNNSTHDVLLQDMWIHGFVSRGIIGPIGGAVTATRVDIAYNGGAGWDFDDGSATPSVNASLTTDGLIIEWNGCNQAYPGAGAISCYGQSNGGYGDGLGTPGGTCISFHLNNSIFRYNTQDGFDGLHNDTGACPSSITNSVAYGNNGQQFKWGPALNPMTFTNNYALGNCYRLSADMAGQVNTYNDNLGDYCRADDTITFSLGSGGSTLIDHNTVISYSPTIFDVECSANGCAGATVTVSNNIVRGYDNPATYADGGQAGGPGAFFFNAYTGATVRTKNTYFGIGHGFVPAATEQIADPHFVGEPASFTTEAALDVFDTVPQLPTGSALAGLGATGTAVVVTPPPPPPPPAPAPVTASTTVTFAPITATPPRIKVQPPSITVTPPAITVQPPAVTVTPPAVTCTATLSADGKSIALVCK